jgi:hypothetical protein
MEIESTSSLSGKDLAELNAQIKYARGEQPAPQNPVGAGSSKVICHSCKQPGHKVRRCPKAPLCDHCGARGHTRDKCSRISKPKCSKCSRVHDGTCRRGEKVKEQRKRTADRFGQLAGPSASVLAQVPPAFEVTVPEPKIDVAPRPVPEVVEATVPDLPPTVDENSFDREEFRLAIRDGSNVYRWPRDEERGTKTLLEFCQLYPVLASFLVLILLGIIVTFAVVGVVLKDYWTLGVAGFISLSIILVIWYLFFNRRYLKVSKIIISRNSALADYPVDRTIHEELTKVELASLDHTAIHEFEYYRVHLGEPVQRTLSRSPISRSFHLPHWDVETPPFRFSLEQAVQLLNPRIISPNTSSEEFQARIDLALRGPLAVGSNKYGLMTLNAPLVDASIVARHIFEHRKWLMAGARGF